MKTTGVVRRIDELGRIVIPKEIRKTLRIRDGESLEIFTENDNIILKKFSVMSKIEDYADKFTESIYSFIKYNIIVTDTDNIIAFSGPLKKDYLNKPISDYLHNCISRRDNMHEKYKKRINLTENEGVEGTYAISTIVADGDAVGLVVILSEDNVVTEVDMRVCQIAARFLAKALED